MSNLSPMLRFLGSMKIGYIEWHDGICYDQDALDDMTHNELQKGEAKVKPEQFFELTVDPI